MYEIECVCEREERAERIHLVHRQRHHDDKRHDDDDELALIQNTIPSYRIKHL